MQAIANRVEAPSPILARAAYAKESISARRRAVSADLRRASHSGGFRRRIFVEEARPPLAYLVHRRKCSAASHLRAAYSGEQEAIVKNTWAILKKDATQNAIALFSTVFEIAPTAKKLFSFLKDSDVPIEKNPKLKKHALLVFTIICEAASSLSKKGEVSTPGSTMKDMAHAHVLSGVVDEHYEVVRYSLLKTVQAGLPADMWNDKVKDAWGDAYDELVVTIKSQEEYPVKA